MTDKISYVGPLSEDEYLNVVLGIQKAMAVEPFQPSLIDVVKLLSDWRTLTNEVERLKELLAATSDYIAHDERSKLWREVRTVLGNDKEC